MRVDTAANWAAANTLLIPAEFGVESDTWLFKVGDGVTRWNDLDYYGTGGSGGISQAAADVRYIKQTAINTANGVAGLDADGLISAQYLPIGTQGPPGKDGQIRFTGHGAPTTIVDSEPGDTYLDLDTGDVYKLT